MRCQQRRWAWIAALAIGSAAAGVDQVQIDLLAHYPLPLRWDNVEGAPQWVAGVPLFSAPVSHWQEAFEREADAGQSAEAPETGLSLVRLAPGESVTVWTPANEALRVYRPAGRLALGDLEFTVSDGSGLYLGTTARPSAQGQSLILLPNWPAERLIQVRRPVLAPHALEVALFVSRRDALSAIAPYRQLIEPVEPVSSRIQLWPSDAATAQPFWPLQAQPVTRIPVRGPLRLALENRLRYPLPEVETRQTYRIYARLDGRPWQVLDFVAGAETRRAVWVNECAETLGRLETGYLDVPDGEHELTLEATQPLYARLLAQADPDYLAPGLNAPKWTAAQARAHHPVQHGSLWDLTAAELARPLDRMTLAEEERTALRLGRDNRYRNGGLTAAMALRQSALAHREAPALTGQAQDVAGLFTFYRNLLPAHKPTATPQRFIWLNDRQLLALDDRPRERIAAERFDEALLDTLPGVYFTELPAGGELEYLVPERDGPSLLRIAVDTAVLNGAKTFWLRYDNQPPLPLHVETPELAGRLFLPSAGETAVMLLSEQQGQPAANTLNAPFATLRTPGPLMPAAQVETRLPTEVRRIRLGGATQPLAVAVQYRASRPYTLTESAYLDTVRRLGPDAVQEQFQTLLRAAFSSQERPDRPPSAIGFDSTQDARRELDNHWLPLSRWLNGQARRLMATLGPEVPAAASLKTSTAEAQRWEDTGETLRAMESWSSLTRSPNVATRAQALAGQTRTLDRLDEEFMAELLLRGTFLHDTDAGIREQAFSELTRRYRAADDDESLLNLMTLAAARDPQPARLREWINVLLAQNQPEFALMVALTLPPAEWPAPDMAQAAYTLGWPRVFDWALERLPDMAQRDLWRGYRAHRQGDHPAALRLWRQAGAPGQALIEALEAGLAIRTRLADTDAATREHAITEWNAWRIRHPGPWIWRAVDDRVVDHAGAALLYTPERNLYAQRYRAEPDRPLRVAIYGPARLRIKARLIHSPGTTLETPPVNDWLLVRDGSHIEKLPVTGDRPAQGLSIVGASATPGREIRLDYTVGPGFHTLDIMGGQRPLLAQVENGQPALPLLILPEWTPQSVVAAALGANRNESPHGADWRLKFPWDWRGIQHESVNEGVPEASLPVQVITDCRLEPRSLPTAAPWPPDEETFHATLARLTTLQRPELVWPEPPPTPEQQLRARLIALLWDVEQEPAQWAQRLPEAEQWVAAQPGVPGVEALMRRLRARADWEPVVAITHSAGLHDVAVRGWQPETPMLRVRKALASPVKPDEQVLFGNEQLGLLIDNPTPSRLRIELRAMDVRYLPPQPLTVWRQIDDQPEQRLTLPPAAPTRALTVEIPPGQHVLRLGMSAPLANQFLSVRVSELRGGVARPVTGDLQRRFQVATAAEPLRMRIEGPTWLRIDEERGTTLDSRYRYFGPGLHDLELKPGRGQTEALFRVHRQIVLDGPRETLPPRVTQLTLAPVPIAPVAVPTPIEPNTLATIDRYALGEQQQGTWSLGATLARAIPPPEEFGDRTLADEYLEILGTWRQFTPWRKDHYQLEGLYRLHRLGSPTLGLRGSWRHETDWPGVFFRLGWEGYAQESGAWAWNSTVRGQLAQSRDLGPQTRHQPSLGFFHRDLHQQSGYDYRAGYVDQDVLSEYKYLHRRGLVLADTLVHRPWLDTIWYAGAALTADEQWNLFDPEHASATLGWKQLLGAWETQAAYQRTWYFAQDERDWNRPEATQSHTLQGNLLWDGSWGGQGQLRAGLEWQYDINDRELGSWLSIEWFPDRGRGYRDFRPGQVDFRDLRERQLPLDFNNRLNAQPGEDAPP